MNTCVTNILNKLIMLPVEEFTSAGYLLYAQYDSNLTGESQ
jgi:hypothetical protein